MDKRRDEEGLGMRVREDLASRQVGMDWVIYDPDSGAVHVLNATASSILWHVTPDRAPEEIARNIALSFKGGRDVEKEILSHVRKMLKQFRELNLFTEDRGTTKRFEREIVVTERVMTPHPVKYFDPQMSSQSVDELMRKGGIGAPVSEVAFCDTWNGI